MGKRAMMLDGEQFVLETARIVCEEAVLDYRAAKLKAAQRLGLGTRAALPDNARIQVAVIEYQRLYGGEAYRRRLRRLRTAAVQAMRLLSPFRPCLVGAVASGAVTQAHRVQLHGFADLAESLELFLQDRGIPCRQDDREYRYADGGRDRRPVVRFEAGDVGVDVAMFEVDDLRRRPLSPHDGLPVRRLDLDAAQRLAEEVAADP